MLLEEAKPVAENQRRRLNELVGVFDRPQSPEVMARLLHVSVSRDPNPSIRGSLPRFARLQRCLQ